MDEFQELGFKIVDKGSDIAGIVLGKALGAAVDAYIQAQAGIEIVRGGVEQAEDLASTVALCGNFAFSLYRELASDPEYTRGKAFQWAVCAGLGVAQPVYLSRKIHRVMKKTYLDSIFTSP